jgi:hypothetical protein
MLRAWSEQEISMGSAGDSYTLVSLPDREKAPDKRVRDAIVSTLAEVWDDFLPYACRETASGWILLGLDSLLTVEVGGGQVIFWFYESVAWPEGIANHWLDLALAARRRDFELALEPLGYAIDPADWPDLSRVHEGATRLFFWHGGDVGEANPGRGEVDWQWREYGKSYEMPSTPYDELDAAARQRVDAVIALGRCACPVCDARFGPAKVGPFEPAGGHETRREALFSAKDVTAAARIGDTWLVAASSRAHASWAVVAPSLAGPFATVTQLSSRRLGVDHVAVMGSSAVAQIGASSVGERLFSRSDDGGRTWTAPARTAGLPALKRARFFDGGRPGIVLCAGYPSNEIYRSTDGGASFEVLVKAPAAGGDPIRVLRALLAAGDRLFAIVETKAKKKGVRLCTSADGGASFQDVDVPGLGEPRLLAFWSAEGAAAVCCVGTGGAACSVDAGASWSMASIGAGSPASIAVSTKSILVAMEAPEPGVYASADGGRTWALASRCAATRVLADPTGESMGLVAVEGTLCSIRRCDA